MSLTLVLTRHAKSDWDDPRLDDFDRPLNDRGRASARALGRWLAEQGVRPDAVVVSGARRTVETWEGMAPELPPVADVRVARALYHAPASRMLDVLHHERASCVLMIGHNPGIAEFAERFAARPPDHLRFFDYPTAATTIFEVPRESWAEARWGEADVTGFAIPRDLLSDRGFD